MLLSLGVYLLTLHPGVGPFLDSIELQTAALVRGVIHPPGSPQYLLLSRLAMSILPGADPAYRLNLMSALAGSMTVGVVYLLSYRLTRSLFSSGFAALSLALGPLFWFESSITELYALNALYVALVLYLLLAWRQTGRKALYWMAAIVYALSFGNHLSMILLLPAFLYTVLSTDRAMLLRPCSLLLTLGIVLPAALQYLYIPMRAAAQPPFCNYCPGLVAPPGDYLRGPLLDYLTGGPFKGQMFTLPARAVLGRLLDSAQELNKEFMPWGCLLGLIGAWGLARHEVKAARLLLLAGAAEYIFVMGYAIPDWYTFLTPCYVIFAPLIGYGAHVLWKSVGRRVLSAESNSNESKASKPRILFTQQAFMAVLPGLAVLSLLAGFCRSYRAVDQSHKDGDIVRGKALLEKAQPGAWLLMPRPASPDFYYSWALRYLDFAANPPADAVSVPLTFYTTWNLDLRIPTRHDLTGLVLVSAPEVNPPPGPEPYYLPWEQAASRLADDRLLEAQRRGSRPQMLVLDAADDRVQAWGLLPICTPAGSIAGYEVVSLAGPNHASPVPLVEDARWETIREGVYYPSTGGEPVCPED